MFTEDRLPLSLWRDGVLHFPDWLNDTYESTLESLGLLEFARRHDGPWNSHGGESIEATHDHFCKMYLNSASRVQCLILDPTGAFEYIARDLLASFSSHHVAILDLPCGSGASVLSALSNLTELRRGRLLPTTPLTVSILGADISDHATAIYRDQFERLVSRFRETGINASLATRRWNACDVQQTNQVIDDWLRNNTQAQEHLVLISNFSGDAANMLPTLEESFQQVWIRLSSNETPNSTILWIEPTMQSARRMFTQFTTRFARYLWFIPTSSNGEVHPCCEYTWFSRLQAKIVRGTVLIHRYRRAP
jgi:hypothetical protein